LCSIFPFPQVLFYTRMLSDILGRLLPRKKALAITSPAALLALSGALLLCSVAFFVYLQVGLLCYNSVTCHILILNQLAITSPAALLALSGALLLCSVALFVYLQVGLLCYNSVTCHIMFFKLAGNHQLSCPAGTIRSTAAVLGCLLCVPPGGALVL
jgi:membrane-anchored glycerophosphoryl diester phosphodiesterase (GDPDase)